MCCFNRNHFSVVGVPVYLLLYEVSCTSNTLQLLAMHTDVLLELYANYDGKLGGPLLIKDLFYFINKLVTTTYTLPEYKFTDIEVKAPGASVLSHCVPNY